MKTLSELLHRSARLYADEPALAWSQAAGGRGCSYTRFLEMAQVGASHWRNLGFRQGDKVVLCAEASPLWVIALFSIWEAGLVAVPLPATTPPQVVANLVAFSDARAVLLSHPTRTAQLSFSQVQCLLIEEFVPARWADQSGKPFPRPLPEHDRAALTTLRSSPPWMSSSELALLAFTSGSTDQPRGVELSHANLLANLQSLIACREARPGDAFLSVLPPAHLFELTVGQLGPLLCGARIVFPGTLLPNRLLAALRQEAITHLVCVPAMLDALFLEAMDGLVQAHGCNRHCRNLSLAEAIAQLMEAREKTLLPAGQAELRNYLGTSLRSIAVGGAALDPAWTDLAALLRLPVDVGYGLTEASPVVSLGSTSECPRGSVGRPLPGLRVKTDAHGEVLVHGPSVMRAYYRNPTATAATLQESWLRTGDRGYLDDRGFLFITGRLKEAIVAANGETFYPEEAEPFYASVCFAEYCVAALPGPHGNDQPTLFALPASPDLPTEALVSAFRTQQARAPSRLRVERLVLLSTRLPRTASGKVRRRFLAQSWLAAQQSESPQAANLLPI